MQKEQKGAALVVSMVLLVVALLLGLSGAQSSRLEESMAGNSRTMATAMMAAEYGVSRHWQEVLETGGNDACGNGPSYTYASFQPQAGGWERVNTSLLQQDAVYRVEYCRGGGSEVYRIIGYGAVLSGGEIQAQRTVEIMAIQPGSGFLGLSPITVPSPLGSFDPADSNSFNVEGEELVDGSRNPAISVSNAEDKSVIESALSEDRLDNYLGGISNPISESLLEDAALFDMFISMIKDEADSYYYGSVSDPSAGSSADPKVTFIDGDFNQSQGNFSGAGVMVVNGDANLKGTPSFDGLLIVLGDYSVSGGGRGVFSGALLVAPYEANAEGEMDFRDAHLDFSGGGNATYLYDASSMDTAFGLLGEAGEYWADNNASERKPSEPLIASWGEQTAQ